jgi:hypothetical protein
MEVCWLAEWCVVENVSWDVDLLEEGCLMNYWLVELSSSILFRSSFVRSNWILFASCNNVISSMRCFGIVIIFVSVGFVLGLLFCLAVVDLVLVILSFSENIH